MKLPVAIWLLLTVIASAAIVARLEVSGGVLPGEAFTLTAYVTSDVPLLGATYRFADERALGFVIESRDLTGSPFQDTITEDVRNMNIPAAGGPDLGALVDNITIPVTPGDHLLASYVVRAPVVAPGDYKITLGTQSVALTDDLNSIPIFATANVHVVPEASPWLALALFGFVRPPKKE